MILSNEPGYYKEGEYGIRIENLVLVTPPSESPGGDIAMHGFETLTLAPFDQRLLATDLLTRERAAHGSTPIMPACAPRSARCSTARRWPGWKPATAPLSHEQG